MCRPTDPQVICQLSAALSGVWGYLWPWNVVLVAAYAALWSGTRSANVKALRSLQATAAGLFILFGALSGLWPMVGFNVIIAWTHLSRLLALDKNQVDSEEPEPEPAPAVPASMVMPVSVMPVSVMPTAPPMQGAAPTPLTSYPMPVLAPRFIEPAGASLVAGAEAWSPMVLSEVLAGGDLDRDDAGSFDDDDRLVEASVGRPSSLTSLPPSPPPVQARLRRPPARLGEHPGLHRLRRRPRVGSRSR